MRLKDLTEKIKYIDNNMKRGVFITLLSAIAGGLTAFGVVKFMTNDSVQVVSTQEGGAQFRTVSLSNDKYPDFTYAAETCVDAVVYVKVSSTQTIQQGPGSIFDFFFGLPQQGAPQQRENRKRLWSYYTRRWLHCYK